MTFKRVALVVIVIVVSLATFPFSVPVLIVAGGVMWHRRRKLGRMVPTARVWELQVAQLERRLGEARRETEALTRLQYTAWRLRREKEKQYYLVHGVSLPHTDKRAREDEIFTRLEQRMKDEQQRFQEEARRIERQERYRLEDQRQELVSKKKEEESQRLLMQQAESEMARIQAEKDAAALIARALQGDLA